MLWNRALNTSRADHMTLKSRGRAFKSAFEQASRVCAH
jgi:hypothetical protein